MVRRFIALTGLVLLLIAQPALAEYDPNVINYEMQNNIDFRDNGNEINIDAVCDATALGPTTATLDAAAKGRIEALKATYQQAGAQKGGVRWEYIAALDYRENKNNPNKSMLGGEPIGTKATDSDRTPQTKLESVLMGLDTFKGNAKAFYSVDVTKAMTSEALGQALLAYNRGGLYKKPALPLTNRPM